VIKEVESYKYLGVHIDSQLRWNVQAHKGVANATKWVMQFRRLTKISTGMGVKLLRQLYIAVALPKMTYALDVWYTPPTKPVGQRKSIGSVGVLRQMTKLQRLASLAIVGGMKSTPTDLLDAHAGLLPIELTLLRICHRAIIRICTLPNTHPLHPLVRAAHRSRNEKHRDPIKNALRIFKLNPRNFEPIAPDLDHPASLLYSTPTIPKNREDSILTEANDTSDYKIFTDGSGQNGKAGASAVLYRNGEPQALRSLTYHLGDLTRYTINDAESVGALLAAWLVRTTPGFARYSFSIFTDSQILIRSLKKRSTGSGRYLINAFRQVTSTLQTPLKILWIPGHSKVSGNKEADNLAKRAAQGQSSPSADLPPLLHKPLPYSADAEKQLYTREVKMMWAEQWSSSPRHVRMARIDKSFPFTKFRMILHGLSRAQSSLLVQIRSGHIPLNAHLYRLNCVDTDRCLACADRPGITSTKETVTHFLFDCPAYQNERHYLDAALGRHNRSLEHIMSKEKSIRELLQYIGCTKRFKKSHGDVTPSLNENPPAN
jgi:ribonuclease HI